MLYYYINRIFFNHATFLIKIYNLFDMFLLGFRRKLTALALCKSIESAIQWFQIHHRITFATIQNATVYLSGARISIFSTLVPRLFTITGDIAPVTVNRTIFTLSGHNAEPKKSIKR